MPVILSMLKFCKAASISITTIPSGVTALLKFSNADFTSDFTIFSPPYIYTYNKYLRMDQSNRSALCMQEICSVV